VHEGQHRIFLLACDVQALAAGDQHVEIGARLEQLGNVGAGRNDLFENVQEQQ
jgi:hypothetical protein